MAQPIATPTCLYRSTWKSHCPCRSWTPAAEFCCLFLTLTPTLFTSVARYSGGLGAGKWVSGVVNTKAGDLCWY